MLHEKPAFGPSAGPKILSSQLDLSVAFPWGTEQLCSTHCRIGSCPASCTAVASLLMRAGTSSAVVKQAQRACRTASSSSTYHGFGQGRRPQVIQRTPQSQGLQVRSLHLACRRARSVLQNQTSFAAQHATRAGYGLGFKSLLHTLVSQGCWS